MVIVDYELLKDNGKFYKPMISSKIRTKMLYRNFFQMQVNCFKIDFLAFPSHNFFHVLFIIYMEKCFDSHWSRAVQFSCNTSVEICNISANYKIQIF